jgi:PKD repeat protein
MKSYLSLVSRLGACLAVFGGAFLATLPLSGQGNRPEVPPGLALGGNSRGEEAIKRLGKDLPAVARAYDMDGPAFRALLRSQRELWVDNAGHLLFVCEGLGVTDATTAESAVEGSSAVPNSTDAFQLHSRPGSNRIIYLDFDGHTTTGTSWNSSFTGGSSIVSTPFDMDGSPSTFNATERDRISKIWQRVAEDFAAFAVDVTTEDPGVEALRRSPSTDTAYGIRVVISPTSAWYPGAGGVAYVGSFTSTVDMPTFVFSGNLGPNNEKYVAEATSHEVGHTLGLSHDGQTNGTAYYQGHGDWAPIMGVGYYRSVVQWSKGEYALANNTQDDLAIMPSYGAAIAGDDHGNTIATATSLPAGASVAALGVLETRADLDVFRFDTGAGLVSFTVTGTSPQPNVDAKLDLLSSSGSVIASNNATGLNATVTAALASGTYYLRIDGMGFGDPLSTGYSDYASIGEYALTGTVVSTGLVAPVALTSANPTSGTAPLVVALSSSGSSDADGSIVSYSWNLGNGQTSTAANPSATYNSTGVYTATLTVTDNSGLTDTDSVVITALAPPNLAPVASATGTPSSGMAPLTVAFSSAGSFDPDGSIAAYNWNFGDGTSSSTANPSKTYNSVGSYTSTLTITDNGGASDSSSVSISVGQDANRDIDVSSMSLGVDSTRAGKAGVATVRLLSRLNQPVAGAAITITWTGIITGTSSGTTNSNGEVVLISSKRAKKAGTITATVSTISAPASYQYNAALFSEPLTESISASK